MNPNEPPNIHTLVKRAGALATATSSVKISNPSEIIPYLVLVRELGLAESLAKSCNMTTDGIICWSIGDVPFSGNEKLLKQLSQAICKAIIVLPGWINDNIVNQPVLR